MAAAPPNTASNANLLCTYRSLIDTLTSYLTVVTHHILYLRRVYPPVSFVSTRAYNYPVRQNRHPSVVSWINDAIAAVREQLERNVVRTVSVCLFETTGNQVLERWTLELLNLPTIEKRERDVPFDIDESSRRNINVTDLEANYRSNLSRLATVAGKMRPLPEGSGAPEISFTLVMEVQDGADKPIGRLKEVERAWIVADQDPINIIEDSFNAPGRQANKRSNVASHTRAVCRSETGEIRMEMYVEEAIDVKATFPTGFKTVLEKSKGLSYGAGKDKFDPVNGYEPEVDIHRKMGGGANYTKG